LPSEAPSPGMAFFLEQLLENAPAA
jgi:hypothetical protein